MSKKQKITEINPTALQNLIFWKNTTRVLMRVRLVGFMRSFCKDCPYDPYGIYRIL